MNTNKTETPIHDARFEAPAAFCRPTATNAYDQIVNKSNIPRTLKRSSSAGIYPASDANGNATGEFEK